MMDTMQSKSVDKIHDAHARAQPDTQPTPGQLHARVGAAVECGDLLLAEKAVHKKTFTAWAESNLKFSLRQGRKYMKVAQNPEVTKALAAKAGAFNLDEAYADIPAATKADAKQLSYVGSTTRERGASDRWHTPARYTDLAREVMGSIDLDPFSDVAANQRIGAKHYLSPLDDALACPWPEVDTVWMNPPYGAGLITKATARFLKEWEAGTFKQACVLVNNATETNWQHGLYDAASAMLTFKGRIAFETPDEKAESNNTRGQVMIYFGPHHTRFAKVFRSHGKVWRTM